MFLPKNLIFLVLLGVVSPLYAQQINDAPNLTNQDDTTPVIHSTIIPGWEDSAAIALLVVLALIVISVPCAIILIRKRRRNRHARMMLAHGQFKAPESAGGRSYDGDDYEMGLRDSHGVSFGSKGQERWTLKEVEVIMRGGDPNNPAAAGYPASQLGDGYRPTSVSTQPQHDGYRPTSVSTQPQQQVAVIATTAVAKPVGLSRATSVKVTKVKAVTVVKARERGGEGSTLADATSGASSPRRPETALTRSD